MRGGSKKHSTGGFHMDEAIVPTLPVGPGAQKLRQRAILVIIAHLAGPAPFPDEEKLDRIRKIIGALDAARDVARRCVTALDDTLREHIERSDQLWLIPRELAPDFEPSSQHVDDPLKIPAL